MDYQTANNINASQPEKHPLIKAAEEARRTAGRGVYYCSDCEQDTLVNDDIRCVACGSGRVVAGFKST